MALVVFGANSWLLKDLGTNSGAITAPAGKVHSWETGSGDERTSSGTDLEALSRASGTDTERDSDGSSWTARTDTGLDWGVATGGRSGGTSTGAGSETWGFWAGAVAERTGCSVLACVVITAGCSGMASMTIAGRPGCLNLTFVARTLGVGCLTTASMVVTRWADCSETASMAIAGGFDRSGQASVTEAGTVSENTNWQTASLSVIITWLVGSTDMAFLAVAGRLGCSGQASEFGTRVGSEDMARLTWLPFLGVTGLSGGSGKVIRTVTDSFTRAETTGELGSLGCGLTRLYTSGTTGNWNIRVGSSWTIGPWASWLGSTWTTGLETIRVWSSETSGGKASWIESTWTTGLGASWLRFTQTNVPGISWLRPSWTKGLGTPWEGLSNCTTRALLRVGFWGHSSVWSTATGVTAAAVAASELTILDLNTFEVVAANLAISGMKESDLTGSGLTGEDWTDSWITGTDLGSSAVIASSLAAVNSVDSETDTAVLAALFLLSLRFNVGDWRGSWIWLDMRGRVAWSLQADSGGVRICQSLRWCKYFEKVQ